MPRPLRREIQREPEGEEGVERCHEAEIAAPRVQRAGVGRIKEHAKPKVGKHCQQQPDTADDHRRRARSGPGHAQGAVHLTGAHIRPDHRRHRGTNAKDHGDHQKFEPRAKPVTGQRLFAEPAHEPCHHDDSDRGQQGIHRRQRPDAEDIAKHADVDPAQGTAKAKPRAPRQDMRHRQHSPDSKGEHDADGQARHAKCGQRAPPQGEAARQGDRDDGHQQQEHGRGLHVARATNNAERGIAQPDRHAAGKEDQRIGRGGRDGIGTAPQQGEKRHAKQPDQNGHDHGKGTRDHPRDYCQCGRPRAVLRAKCARHRSRDRPTDGPRRQHLRQHDQREHQRQTGQRCHPKKAGEIRLGYALHGLHEHRQDIGRGKLGQRRRDWGLKQGTGPGGAGLRRGGGKGRGGVRGDAGHQLALPSCDVAT